MARVVIIDPYSGVEIDVDEHSPQARAWGVASPAEAEAVIQLDTEAYEADEAQSDSGEVPAEAEKRKPGRPKKS